MEYHPLPQPEEVTQREREDAMGSYFMMFATTAIGLPMPIINMIAAIVYYYVNKSKGRYVQFHTLQSLYSQIPVTALNLVLVVWLLRNLFKDFMFTNMFWGFLAMTLLANLIYFAFSIVAAVRANKGRFYYFMFFGKLAYHVVYKKDGNFESAGEMEPVNKAPKM